MMGRVQNKVVLLTGAAGGVAKEAAAMLAREGATVVLADIDETAGQSAARQIGESATFLRLDVSSEADWQDALSKVVARFGRLDALVNSAAICRSESIEETSLELFRTVSRINAEGTFLGCKHAIAQMKTNGGGSIVNLSSTAALAGHTGLCAYSASKGAVSALTRNVAAHCRAHGYRIRCNSIHPAGIRTAMSEKMLAGVDEKFVNFDLNPQSGVCEPHDVAHLILFLVSDESRFISGAELRVDNAMLTSVG
ncbi:SDR family oxidoreductase [Pandoraea vervacti]